MAGAQLERILGFRLVTQDLSRLGGFYRTVLGFEVEAEQPILAAEMALLGLAGQGRRLSLRIGGQALSIDQFETAGRPYPAAGDAASLWFQHLALVVPDIGAAYARLRCAAAISLDGPQHLPPASGGASAYKFRDPDGHPLELLQFPTGGVPSAWRQGRLQADQIALGVDHSAISVADADASAAFYENLGLETGKRTLNEGPAQQRLDGLRDVRVAVVPMQPPGGTPHLELLGYEVPRGRAGDALRPNDVAATRIVWRGALDQMLADPDGHLQQIETR